MVSIKVLLTIWALVVQILQLSGHTQAIAAPPPPDSPTTAAAITPQPTLSPSQFMLREDIFTVIEGDPGDDTLVLIIVDIVDGTPDIQLNFTVSSNATRDVDYQIAVCSNMSSSSMNETSDSGMANATVALCLNITIFGDDTVEDMEYINVNFTLSDDQASFVGPSQAQVHIMDDDGVNLVVSPQNVGITEGETGEICVEFTQGQILAERAVTFSVSDSSNQTELKINNDSFLISSGDNRTCFEIEAVDDTIIEDIKVVNVTVIPVNPNDQVMDGVVSVTIMDNDMVELMVVDDVLTVPEGGTALVCVNVTNSQQMREIDIILSFSVTEGEGRDYRTINGSGMFIVTPQDSQVCLQFSIIDDDNIEDSENFIVTIVRSGQIVGNTTVVIEDNDGAEVTLPNFVNALEGGTSQVCVSISPFFIRERDVVVMLTLIPNSQFVNEADATIVNYTTLIIAPQSDSACVTVEPIDDEIAEGTESFNLTAMANNTFDSVNGTTTIEIPANDGVTISLLGDAVSIMEGENTTISIHLSLSAEREVPVMLRVLLGSAFSNESDILAVATPMSYFAPGMIYLSIQLEAIDDQITEDVEVFEVIVEAMNPLDSVSSQNSSTVYILDNDGEDVILPEFVSATEGTTFQVCATVSAVYPTHERDIILTFTLTPESDFANYLGTDARIIETTVIIAPQSDSACVTVEPVDDEIAEGTEFFNLTAMANNTLDSVNGTTTIEIPANDGVTISLLGDAVSIMEGENTTISIHLSSPAEREVPVMLRVLLGSAFSNESDILAVATPMSYFAPGMMYLSIQLEAIDDQITEDVEVFDIIVEAMNPLDSVSSQNSSTVYILDNDGEDVILPEFVSAIEGTTFQVCATVSAVYPTHERDIILTFTLTPESDFANYLGTDARIIETTVIIAPQTDSACVTVEPVDDEIAEGTEFFNLTAMANNTLDSVNGTTTIEIPANDGVTISLLGDAVSIMEGENTTISIHLSLSAEREVPVMLRVLLGSAFSNESDILAVATPMSYFAPGTIYIFIQLEAIDDQITEDVEVFEVIVEAMNPLDSVSSQNSSTVYILDNDGEDVNILPEFVSAIEGTTFQVCATVSAVYPTHERDIILTFTLTPESDFANYLRQTDARIIETTVIIAPQTDSACVTVEPVDDEIAEGTEFFNLTAMANNTLDSVNGTTTIEIPANDGVTISLLGDVVSIMEGENTTISIHLSLPAEREVPVMLRVLLGSAFSNESDILAVATPMSYFAPGMMYLSIQLEAIDDQITEDVEVFDIIVEAMNPLDSVSSQNSSTVYILDNDGEDVILPEFVSAIEGTTFQVCAAVSAVYPTHERDIILTFTLTPESDFTNNLGQTDARIIETTVIIVPQTDSACVTVEPVDDEIAEGTEFFNLTAMANNTLDSVNSTTTIEISDNDELTPVLEINSLLITLPDFTLEMFTSARHQQFRMTVADAINGYCRTESCLITEISRRKRQTGVMVTANDIILRDIRNNDQNQLQFSMFVQTNNGQNVLQSDTVQRAIQRSNSTFITNGFTGLSISPLIVPTTQPPAPTASSLSDGAIAGIVIGTVVGAVLLVLLFLLISVLVRHCTNRRKYVLNTYEIQRKPKGPASLRESFHDKSDQNLYVQAPNVLTSDNDEEPIVSIQMTVLAEKEKEEEPEIFINKVATESENGVSLSKDIARELGEGQETQVMKMSFDEPGEETKF